MNVLLLTHPITVTKGLEDNFGMFPPLGLAYIGAILENHGHKVKTVDCFAEGFQTRANIDGKIRIGLRDNDILAEIKNFNPQVVGISNNFTSFVTDALNLTRIIKKQFPQTMLIMGGAHPTMDYEEIIKLPYVDLIVRGEGEYTMVELLENLSRGNSIEKIKGIVWKKDDSKIVVNETKEPIPNLDSLPIPAYHLLNMTLYLTQKSSNFQYSKKFPVGHLVTSRGCRYNCIFCSTTKLFRKFRAHSSSRVLEEMEFLIKKYRVREIHFHDDSFLCDSKRVLEICNGILERNLNITWQISQGITICDASKEMLELMYKSGMYRIGLPIESGSKRILKFIRKPIDLDRTIEVINQCNKLGVYTHGNFIIGFPNETKGNIEETASFIYRSNLDFVKLLICQPLAGSDLYEVYKKEGLLGNFPKDGSVYEHTKYDTLNFSARELNKIRNTIIRKFVKNKLKNILSVKGLKRIIFPKVNSLDKLVYFIRLVLTSFRRILLNKPLFGI